MELSYIGYLNQSKDHTDSKKFGTIEHIADLDDSPSYIGSRYRPGTDIAIIKNATECKIKDKSAIKDVSV